MDLLNKNQKLAWNKIMSKLDDNERIFIELEKEKAILDDIMVWLLAMGCFFGFVFVGVSFIGLWNTGIHNFTFNKFFDFSAVIVASSVIPMVFNIIKIEPKIRKLSKIISNM